MTSLGEERGRSEIRRRVLELREDAGRRWGKMSAHQMLVHLRDSYEVGLGRRAVTAVKVPGMLRPPLKWLALRSGLRWARGSPTMPEVDQFREGTRPVAFEPDRAALLRVCEEFSGAGAALAAARHPFFGAMTAEEWLRWGYLHADHHLRQFGA